MLAVAMGWHGSHGETLTGPHRGKLPCPKQSAAYAPGMSEPFAPPPEDRDWTYVITQGCSECGFTPFDATLAASRLRASVPRWRAALAGASATTRPAPLVWSPLEYGCHVRDVN